MNQISIEDLRSFYPQYSDLSDEELANKYTDKTGNEVIFSQSTVIEEPKSLIPEAGTYSQDDIAENDNLYYIVEGYMADRYGSQSIEGESRESIVDSFLNNRRGVVSGNTVRGLSEMDYINDIKNDSQRSARAAAAYQLYENMAGIFSGETTIGEKAEGIMDFTRSVILDPVNLVGGLIGKAAANGSLRVGTYAAKRAALEAGKREGTKEAAEKVITKTFTDGLKASRTATKAKIGHYAQQTLGKTAIQRLKTKAAIKEIGIVTGIDAAVGAGMEYLYQDGLVDVDAQEDINYLSVGIAAAGGIILGGIQAGLIARRGVTDTAVQTMEFPEPEVKGFLSEASQAIANYVKQDKVPIGRDWKTKLKDGAELSKDSADFSSDFFKVLLLGHVKEDEIVFRGMTQIAYERGFVWAPRFKDDRFTNWMSDIISGVSDKEAQGFLSSIEKATGNKIRVRGDDGKIIPRSKITGKDIGDILSYKASEAGASLGALGQSAKQLGLSITDAELKDLYQSALDANIVKTKKPKEEAGIVSEAFQKNQNRLIRLLVSHPSTSALNVIGWGANTSLQTTSDLVSALLYAGQGTLQKLAGDAAKGAKTQKLAADLFAANAARIKFLLDPDMTYTAFQSALTRNSEALQRLDNVLPGGVEGVNDVLTGGKFSPSQKLTGLKVDDKIDLVQKLALVQAQDGFTKSQEFLFQMDKKLRVATGKGWNEFYRSTNIGDMPIQKYMASKEYRDIEASAVEDTLEAIFSKSYKGRGTIGMVAGGLEDMRNLPGLGMMVPFGRFFNNTIAFMGKNAPGVNLILKGAGFFDDMSKTEAVSRSLVTAGTIFTLSEQEMDNVRQGLPMYSAVDPLTGEITSQQYDFPVSAYRAGARILALSRMEEYDQAWSAFKRFGEDFGLQNLLRNLNQTERNTIEAIEMMVNPERRDFAKASEIALTTLSAQYLNPLVRPLEPLNVVAGIARGEDAAPIDRNQNNKFINNAFRYVDNIIPLFSGKPLAEPRETAAGGTADIQSTKILGARVIRLTDTQRVMARMGLREFDINAARKIRDQVPQAANAYNGILFDIIEAESSLLMESDWFEKLTPAEKLQHWDQDVLPRAKDLAKTFLRLQYSGAEDVISQQYNITSKYSKKDVQKATRELNLGEIEDLETEELYILNRYLETEDALRKLSIYKKQRGN